MSDTERIDPHHLPMADPRCVAELWVNLRDPQRVAHIVDTFDTWADMWDANAAVRVRRLGTWAARMPLPHTPRPLDDLVAPMLRWTRWEPEFPNRLRPVTDAWPIVYALGVRATVTLASPLVCFTGARFPSPSTIDVVTATATAAAAAGVGVVGLLDTGVGRAALSAAVAAGGTAVGVAAAGLAWPSIHTKLVTDIVAGGGAVLSTFGPDVAWDESSLVPASVIAAGIANNCAVAELDGHTPGAFDMVRTASAHQRNLIVLADPGNSLTPEPTLALTEPAYFTERMFPGAPRLAARAAAQLPPADAVVATVEEFVAALDTSATFAAPTD